MKPPSPNTFTISITFVTTDVPKIPKQKITSAKILNDTNDNKIVVRPHKKSPIFENISFIIFVFFKLKETEFYTQFPYTFVLCY